MEKIARDGAALSVLVRRARVLAGFATPLRRKGEPRGRLDF